MKSSYLHHSIAFPETVFPPVFGRRLQAQVVRIGERARLEVEVAGTPEPDIKWHKDGMPISDSPGVRVVAQGCCHTLIIEKGMSFGFFF